MANTRVTSDTDIAIAALASSSASRFRALWIFLSLYQNSLIPLILLLHSWQQLRKAGIHSTLQARFLNINGVKKNSHITRSNEGYSFRSWSEWIFEQGPRSIFCNRQISELNNISTKRNYFWCFFPWKLNASNTSNILFIHECWKKKTLRRQFLSPNGQT
jgi:hypothetical protein